MKWTGDRWGFAVRCLLAALTSLIALLGGAACAQAVVIPARTVAGPSPKILSVGNVAMAADGTGGVVWLALYAGQPHVFVSRFQAGRWSRPIQADVGQAGPASFPVISAADGGELLVAWVQPWASVSTGGNPPTTVYQLVSALMQPGSNGFGPPIQVDPGNVGDGTGVYPDLAMTPNGTAYIVYRVVTNPLTPNQPQPPGTIGPMRPGDELVDVRAARFNGLYWSSTGVLNRLPGQVTMRKPTASNAPVVAVDHAGDAVVAWQEPSIDGFARIWARRLFGTTQGSVLQVSPTVLNNKTVNVDADAPALGINNYAGAEVAFRLKGGSGSPLHTPYVMVNSLPSNTSTAGAAFTTPVAVAGASTVGPPSVSVGDAGNFESMFTGAGMAYLSSGNVGFSGPAEPVGSSNGDPAMATLDPNGGDAIAWPALDPAGRPIVKVRERLSTGQAQLASLSAPLSGPISSLTIGPSGQGSALIAFQQGLGLTTQVAVAEILAPPLQFASYVPSGWVRPRAGVAISWDPALAGASPVSYSVLLDGRIVGSHIRTLDFGLKPGWLGDGIHRVSILATDPQGQETLSAPSRLLIDASPPVVLVKHEGRRTVKIEIRDNESGPNSAGTVIQFGDRSQAVHGHLSARHRYRHRGTYVVVVRCHDFAGNSAIDRLRVTVR